MQACEVFEEGIRLAETVPTPPVLFQEEITQPQDILPSGSHERYKSPEGCSGKVGGMVFVR